MFTSITNSICGISIFLSIQILPVMFTHSDPIEEAPINYSETKADNQISRLQRAINNKSITLKHDEKFGYLRAVLASLDISYESQVLVFSKTSFQHRFISPSTPRAIYFNDDTYIGTVQNGDLLELSTADPVLGAVFYVLPQNPSSEPQFLRLNNECLQCHASTITRGIPGHVVRSVFPDDEGFPIFKLGSHVTTQESPMEERWGGWYVTGTHGNARHMGNAFANDSENEIVLDREPRANRTALDKRVDRQKYLTPHSDIVALMVLEHQTEMHNMITNANYETRKALHSQSYMDEILKRNSGTLSESTKRRISNAGNKLVDYMLFVNEMKLDEPVQGTSGFAESFSIRGPFDRPGRSLREFDLENRLFRYPLSYLIYSPQFDGLPKEMKAYVYKRLWDILTGKINAKEYSHLTADIRRAIGEILVDTKPNLPQYWK